MPSAPNPVAVAAIRAKTPIGSSLDTQGWSQVPLGLRESAQFSATVERLRFLQRLQDRIETAIANARRDGTGAFQTRERFMAELQQIAREEGLDPVSLGRPDLAGGLQDVTSLRRLGLIWDIQIEKTQEFAKWKMDQDPDVLNAYPAQELIRVADRKKKRDWLRRWDAAGGRLTQGRMVALKTDPIWRKLSRFGTPWPPFDFGSGMGLRDLSRREAIALGLLKKGEVVQPIDQAFNEELQASVADLGPKMRSALQRAFGDQVQIVDKVATWRPGGTPPPPDAPPLPPIIPRPPSPPAEVPIVSPEVPTVPPRRFPNPTSSAVSSATRLELSTKKDAVRARLVLDAIDAVHGDGPLLPIPINNRVSRNAAGTYWSGVEQASNIGIRRGIGDSSEVTLAHEIGHWLDHIGIASPGKFASETAKELEALMTSMRDSDAVKKIVADANIPFRYRNYLLSGRELFARAYSQFIAEESGRSVMLAEIAKPNSYQWSAEDFAPIREEFRKLFASLGWLK